MKHLSSSAHRSICPVLTRTVVGGLLAACFLSSPAFACAVCFGDPNSSQTQGMNWAIVTMLAFVAAAFAGLGGFAYALWRRSQPAGSTKTAADEYEMPGVLPVASRLPEGLPS